MCRGFSLKALAVYELGRKGGGGVRNKNGTLMRAGCRLVRAFTIPLEHSPYRHGGLVAIARQKEGWWF